MTDRNGTLHTYVRDVLGRQTSDQATSLGTGVNGSVRRLDTAYDTGGRPYLFTSVDQPMGGNVLNQVEDLFNGFGQLVQEYQSHSGAVTGSTPSVQYAYSYVPGQMTNPNHSRLVSMTYPNGRVLHYGYNAGLDDAISRLSFLADDDGMGGIGTHLEDLTDLGLSTVVQRSHPEDGINLSYINTPNGSGTAGDQYNGLDMFGRVVDQYWATGGGTVKDEFTYGYDRDSNRLSRNNILASGFNESYTYDNLNQLTMFTRGSHQQSKEAFENTELSQLNDKAQQPAHADLALWLGMPMAVWPISAIVPRCPSGRPPLTRAR